jgi:hypothetical protein
MIKLLDLLREEKLDILKPRRSEEERQANFLIATNKKIEQYIKDGGKGDLVLRNTPIITLPNGLKVGGNLYLRNTKITSLPNGLTVGGYLYLSNTPITTLPNDLKVGGNLYLGNTPITSLPNDLKVEGDLYLEKTPISKKYSEEEIKKMVPGVKGNIYI